MQRIISLFAIALLTMSAWADTVVTLDFSAQSYNDQQQIHELAIDGVTVTFDKGTNTNNPPTYYNTGTAVRLYPGNTMTVTGEILPKQRLIRLNETLNRNQVYAEDEDFAFVADYIRTRCRNAKVKLS